MSSGPDKQEQERTWTAAIGWWRTYAEMEARLTAAVSERMLDTAPFVSMGEYAEGCLTRIATDPLLNVTAGGGSTVPTFVIEPR